MKIRSFKLKLILSHALVILVSFGFIAFFLDKNLEENSLRDIKSALVVEARLIEDRIRTERLSADNIPRLEGLANSYSLKAGCRVTVINNRGQVLADSEKAQADIAHMENHLNRPEIKIALAGSEGSDIRFSPTLNIDMLYVALPVRSGSGVTGAVRLALKLENVRNTLFAIRKTVFYGLLLALLCAFVLASFVAGRTLEPVNRMIQVSRRFASGDFSRKIIRTSGDEIGELAATLNRMAADIENKIRHIAVQNRKLAAIFDSMIEGVIVVDRQGLIVSINPAAEKIFGVTGSSSEGRSFIEAIRSGAIAESVKKTLKDGVSVSAELSMVLPSKGVFEVNAVPVSGGEGVDGCLVVIHDITEMRRLETVRSDFVANVSHELKTPLTSIKGFVETLLDGAMNDKENSACFLRIIRDHAERLNGLVNDLLSLASLESKEITLDKADVPLRSLVEEIVLGSRSQLNKKHIVVTDELPRDLFVNADKDRIGQVFTNLIDNAIKFNKDNGFIKIYTRPVEGKVGIVVEDSGPGISDKDLPRIFERFYRVDKARSRELGGTGLGLSIVKHIVELHGGSVSVESAEGAGSKFIVILPAAI